MSHADRENTVSFDDCEAAKETDKALLVYFGDLEKKLWVPKSQIHDDSEVWEEGQSGTLVVTGWWAGKNGLL